MKVEEKEEVIHIRMTTTDFDDLMVVLGYAAGAARNRPDDRILTRVNRLIRLGFSGGKNRWRSIPNIT
jgi:hypothetical protein